MNNVGLVGFGYWGKVIYQNLINNKSVRIIKVYSSKDYTLDDFTKELDKVINSNDISHVFVASPTNTHFEIVKKLLISSKNVFCEKPLTINVEEIEVLFSLAFKNDLKLLVDYTYLNSSSLQNMLLDLTGKDIISISLFMNQLGPFYDESVGWTLGTHAISIIDEIIPLHNYKLQLVNFKKDGKGIIRQIEVFGTNGNSKVYFEISLISKKKRQLRIETTDEYYSFDMLDSPSVVVRNKSGVIINSFGEAFDEINNLNKGINSFLSDNLTYKHYIKTHTITSIINHIHRSISNL
jgi:hypothetical protein